MMRHAFRRSSPQRGFTLVEMIMVIVITGIIGGIVAVFLRAPIQQYTDVARRADISDTADTALRRISRDLRLALPNSVRVAGDCGGENACSIEFLPTVDGGRYRTEGGGDTLDFDAVDTAFEVMGPDPALPADASIVVYNLGIPGASAYDGSNRTTTAVSAAGKTISIGAPGMKFPFESPSRRFHAVTTPVTYVCAPAAGGVGGTLRRYWGYPVQANQPADIAIAPLATASSALLAGNVSRCRFDYHSNVVAQRTGLVTMHLAITEQGETASLYSAAHVSNQP